MAHVPFCHCGCGKKCFPADIERGYAAALELHRGTIYFARKMVCAQKFVATRRPDLKDEILTYYARVGKFHGTGSGRWRSALRATSQSLPDSAPVTLFDFVEDCSLNKLASR